MQLFIYARHFIQTALPAPIKSILPLPKQLNAKYFVFMWLCFASLAVSSNAIAQVVGQFSDNADIGPVKNRGSLSYDAKNQSYTMTASGANIWGQHDEMHFAWNRMNGDFIVRARIQFQGEGVDPHRKAGWTVRSSLASQAAHVNATVHGDGLTALQFRAKTGGDTSEYRLNLTNTNVIQLERRGDVFIMSAAKHGEPFQTTQVSHLKLGDEVYVGLALSAHNPEVIETASFDNVRIIRPAAPDFQPYRDYIGSNIEVLNLASKQRRILYRSPDSLQAPNWTHDGKSLIYNANGLMYNFDLANADKANYTPTQINTGFANQNNNDHVLSWDGKSLAISHHNIDDERRSTIYTLPITGSDKPKQITKTGIGHSFLHGYSPDDKGMVFTANRKDQYDIYHIDIASGVETQLTNTATLDDGSEYSADGKFIYFNSNRTGTMQLWRMNADGSNQTQLTFDSYNDWFPHLSPDGKSLVFLSYMSDIDSGDHPFYRHVYLRQMPIDGGEPSIIAYIYGGQGTINVPSWSPDGKSLAFISNTQLPSQSP
ncbi:TolB family protein [Teredinibacter waterburyi]|uniref:TolB family protein n=1 Tax=Teredinibacter waterburyi TaxID=1500538 RepID=UPI001CAA8786|nr:hypothetical protein [Teredinibacter waterburyi]